MLILFDYNFAANVHQFKIKDLIMAVDVNSGAIHVVDKIGATLISLIEYFKGDFYRAIEAASRKYDPEDVMEAAVELTGLWEDGTLFSDPETLDFDFTNMNVKSLCLNVAHSCNMKCSYCFASQGNFGLPSALMSKETGRQAIDFLLKNSGDITHLEIDFFGGEPLLNMEVVRDLVTYARSQQKQYGKKIAFTLTTNAVLLTDEVMQFILDNDIAVILSLDGRPEVNDRLRLMNNGEGSYEKIVPHIQAMVAKEPRSYYVRGTFTRQNLDFTNDIRHFTELGLKNFSLEPAIGTTSEYAIREEDLPAVLAEYEKLADLLLDYYKAGQDVHFFHYDLGLQRGPCLAKRHTGCGAGVEYLVVTPEGDIYPCHQFVGEKNFLMGNVNRELDSEIRTRLGKNTLLNKEECRKCWARYYCGGGCHANNYFTNQAIEQPAEIACQMHRKRVESAIYLEISKRLHDFPAEKLCRKEG